MQKTERMEEEGALNQVDVLQEDSSDISNIFKKLHVETGDIIDMAKIPKHFDFGIKTTVNIDDVKEYNDISIEKRILTKNIRDLTKRQKDIEYNTRCYIEKCPERTCDFGNDGYVMLRHKSKVGSLDKKNVLFSVLASFFKKVKPFRITDDTEAERLADMAAEFAVANKPVVGQEQIIETYKPKQKRKRKKRGVQHMVFPTYSKPHGLVIGLNGVDDTGSVNTVDHSMDKDDDDILEE